jgi:uncharacterized damage-inducible protein DinB
LKKNSNRQFTPKLISCINEVGIGTSTPRVAAEFLNKSLGVEYFAKGPNRDDFIAMGDENGLFVVSSTDRHWYPTDYKAGEFPIRVKFEVNGRELEYIVDSGPNLQIYYDAPEYCYYFFDLVLTGDLLAELEKNRDLTIAVIKSIPEDKANFAYAKGKWTVKEVLRHIIECERVYSYRAMRFSRFDKMPLPGFDENQYISNVKDMSYTLEDLLEEYTHLRNATIALYKNMTPEMLDFRGTANGEVFTARSLGFMAVGHNVHHLKVLQKKYLK